MNGYFEPNPRRTPLKGQPNFTSLSDKRLKEYADVIQEMIFAYKHHDKEATVVLQRVHKEINNNLTDRSLYDIMSVSDEQNDSPKKGDEIVKKTFQKPRRIKLVKSI